MARIKIIAVAALLVFAIFSDAAAFAETLLRSPASAGPSGAGGPVSSSRPAILTWKHGTTKAAAVESLKSELRRQGYARYVRWDGCEVSSRVTRLFFRIIDARGRVTDEAVVIERCRGMASAEVMKRCREALQRLFPGGGPLK